MRREVKDLVKENKLVVFVKKEIAMSIRKAYKTGVSDSLVGELLEFSGLGMVNLLEHLFGAVWQEEVVPKEWR